MKLLHIVMSLGLCIGALAHPSTAHADAPLTPIAKPALAFSAKFETLGTIRRGASFTFKVRVVNGLVYGLPALNVKVAADGIKLSSAATKVFKNIGGNGGNATVVIKGKLLDDHGVLHLAASTGVIDEGVGPFEYKINLPVGISP
jgi:hypothetical protein